MRCTLLECLDNTFLHLLRLSATLTGEDYTFINYPLNFLSPGGSVSLVVHFVFNIPKDVQWT